MNSSPHLGLSLLVVIAAGLSCSAAEGVPYALDSTVNAYVKAYCYQCHGESTQKGDRRFDQLPDSMRATSDATELLEEALDAMNRGDMPPTRKGVRQPSDAETRGVFQAITDHLSRLSDSFSESTTVLRRLTQFEYVNTMRDLLGLRREFFSFTSDFPADAIEHGFDNNGESLTLSDHQLRRSLEVAEASLDAACFFDVQRPTSQRWHYTAKDFNGVDSYERAPVTWRLIVNDRYLEIGHGQPSERHANYVKEFVRRGGVPDDGWYTVSVRAAAANRVDHGYDHEEFERYQDEPLKMALWIAPNEALLAKNAADQRQLVKVWDLPDDQPKVFTQRIWLDKGGIPFMSWTNGVSSKGNIRRVAEKHHPEVIRATKTQRDAAKLGNGPLAAQYGIEGIHGEPFRKVALEPEDHRGGLLGQCSVLTVTANGIETSPVVRGIWVLENILGTPPPPPPADVEPLEPDTRGTTTIRQQLEKHRSVATCAACHRRIDPAGFALEFF
ncbi:MAG: DUF1588 domain-containing protein [Planctomycetota bacterium]